MLSYLTAAKQAAHAERQKAAYGYLEILSQEISKIGTLSPKQADKVEYRWSLVVDGMCTTERKITKKWLENFAKFHCCDPVMKEHLGRACSWL
jgi:hypothetical protein